METLQLAVKDCKMQAFARRLGALSSKGLYRVTGRFGVRGLLRRTAPQRRPIRKATGTEIYFNK